MTFRSVFQKIYYAFAYIYGGGMCQIGSETTLCINVTVWRISKRKQRMYSLNLWVFLLPHLAGRVCPGRPEYRSELQGFDFSHRPKHFYRSILAGTSYEYAMYLNQVKGLYPEIDL
jgi:sugar (pentulose or hexulose) kinase